MAQPNLVPLPFTQVSINGAFWAPRQAANRERGLWAVYDQLQALVPHLLVVYIFLFAYE